MKALAKLNKRNGKIFGFLSKLGSALIIPISILPIAGIMYSIGTIIEHNTVQSIFFNLAGVLFTNLPTLILITISYKFTDNSGEASLFALILWLVFLSTQSIFIQTNNSIWFWNNLDEYFFTEQLGIRTLSTSIFGGIVVGLGFASIYKKIRFLFTNINVLLQRMLLTGSMMMLGVTLALIFLLVWPGIYIGITKFGESINQIGYGGDAFIYGTVNRLLLPFGLHSLLMPVFLHSPAGGTLQVFDGTVWSIIAEGDSQIWTKLYELGIPLQIARSGGDILFNGTQYYLTQGVNPGAYQQGFFPIMIFTFPAAAWAITSKIDDKKEKIIIWTAALTPMLTGISEPFEFLFVFLSPVLYVFHAVATGISFWLLDLTNTSVWLSSGWFIDIILFGIIPQIQGSITNFWTIPVVGIILSIPYLIMFKLFYKYNI